MAREDFQPYINHIVDENGHYKRRSAWTSSDTIELPDGDALTNKVNRGVYIDEKETIEEYAGNPEIDDNTVASDKVWSSQKINAELDTKSTIDDTETTTSNVWSASKTAGAINDVIKDNASGAVDSTYSANKIDNIVHSIATIDDDDVSEDSTWSSQKINSLFDNFGGHFLNTKTIAPNDYFDLGSVNNPFEGFVAVLRGSSQSTPLVFFVDRWGDIVYLSQNPSLATVIQKTSGGTDYIKAYMIMNQLSNANVVVYYLPTTYVNQVS